MTVETAVSEGIKPLTKRKGTGELYFRRPEVEMQLAGVLPLESPEIFERLEIRDRKKKGFLFDETIVYLLREAFEKNKEADIEILYGELNRRIWVLLYGSYGKFSKHEDFEDFGQEVEMVVIRKIFDMSSDKADYAQVNFGDFVVTQARSTSGSKLKKIDKEKRFIEIDKENEDTHDFDPESNDLSQADEQVLIEAVSKLSGDLREIAMLHYLDGWQIESKDPDEPTISKLYGVSSRTIRNRLGEARRLLAEYRGVGR